MQRYLKVVLIIIVVAGFGYTLWQGYSLYKKQTRTLYTVVDAVPSDAIMLFSSEHLITGWTRFSHNNLIWEELKAYPYFQSIDKLGLTADSLLRINPALQRLFEKHELLVAAFPVGSNQLDYLLVLKLENSESLSEVKNMLPGTVASTIREVEIFELTAAGLNLKYFQHDNLLVASANLTLLEKSIAALHQKSAISNNPSFAALRNTGSDNPDVTGRFYVNISRIHLWLPVVAGSSFTKWFSSDVSGAGEWMTTDLYHESNKLVLNGLSEVEPQNFLSVFQGQEPDVPGFRFVVPADAAWIMSVNISDTETFFSSVAAKRFIAGVEEWKKEISNYSEASGVDVELIQLRWLGAEWISFATTVAGETMPYMAFKVKPDVQRPETLFEGLQAADTLHTDKEAIIYNGKTARQVHLPVSYRRLLGSAFSDSTALWYTRVDDYIVFAQSSRDMRQYFISMEKARMADNIRADAILSENFSARGNLHLMFSPARSMDWIQQNGSQAITAAFSSNDGIIKNTEWLAAQFTYDGKRHYKINAMLDYNPTERSNSLITWEFMPENPLLMMPVLIENHQTQGTDLLIQDMSYRLYLVSSTGKIRWQRDLEGPVAGKVQQVDMFNNGKLQMVFACSGKLFMLDILGRDVKNFPVAVQGINFVQPVRYDKESLRLFAGTQTGMRVFDHEAAEVGWKAKDLQVRQIKYVKLGNRDLIIAMDSVGKVKVMNRRGEPELELKVSKPDGNTHFVIEKGSDMETTRIAYISEGGYLIRQFLGGIADSIEVQAGSGAQLFIFDANGDNSTDYVVAGKRTLKAWSRDKSIILNYTAPAPFSSQPLMLDFGGQKNLISLVTEDGELYVLDATSAEITHGRFRPVKYALITDLNKDNHLEYVIVNSSGMIRQYPLD